MSSYEQFATVYDVLMQDVPYDEYTSWVLSKAPVKDFPKLLDVGCGTGTLTLKFHELGYDVSGIDLSEEMLAIANERLQVANLNIPLFAMSMDEIEGFSNIDIVTIPIDSLNYLKEGHQVIETFQRIYASLREGGQLLFDVHSIFKMDDIFMQSPFTYDDGEITYLWYTESGEFDHSVYHDMTFFVLDNETEQYDRFDEHHFQRTYPVETYEKWLKDVGFKKVVVTADWEDTKPNEKSERIFIQAIK